MGVRPSAILEFSGGIALDFDQSVFAWGRHVNNELKKAKNGREQTQIFKQLMSNKKTQTQSFGQLASLFGSRIGKAGT